MNKLKYFIYGVVFYIVAIPIIESVAETLTTLLEIPKGKASIPVLKMSKKIQEMQVDLEKHDESMCFGFDIKSSEDYDFDDDDFDDKKKSKKSKR
jgi:hypothetical protein